MGHKAKLALVWLAVTVAAAGCGATQTHSGSGQSRTAEPGTHAIAGRPGNPSAFAWLRPAPPPAGWSVVHLHSAVFAYPPGWSQVKSDVGAASAALMDRRSGLIIEYLNATPQQGEETLANWASFRPAHNREEGDSDERMLAAAQNLRFRDGHGSCVIDRYATTRTSYQEIACLVRGASGQAVIVAAAQTARWAQAAPALQRAVSAFVA